MKAEFPNEKLIVHPRQKILPVDDNVNAAEEGIPRKIWKKNNDFKTCI